MAARKSLITRVVSHFQRTALREVVFSGHLEPREGGGLDGCQMQPGIAADHRQETRNLSIFCIVFDRLQFSNTTKISKHLKVHLAPRVSHVTFLDQRVIPGSL